MIRKMTVLATVATLSLTALAPAVTAMSMEHNMLTGAVFNELKKRGLPTDSIDNLTLGQIAIIKGIVDGDDSDGKKTQNIRAILNRSN